MKCVCDYFPIRNRYKMSECIHNMGAYTNLADDIISIIQFSDNDHPDVKKAQDILGDIEKRKLYKCVGESVPVNDGVITKTVCIALICLSGNIEFIFQKDFLI